MRAAACLPFLLLAGCGRAGLPSLPVDRVVASFPPHGLADTIVVDALARLPLRRAELVAPGGKITPSGPIDVAPEPVATSYQGVASHPYGGNLAGIGPREDLSQLPSGAAPQTESQLLEMHSIASIAVPDPVAYRRAWRNYHIRLFFGTPPAPLDSETIPAPAPPSG